MGTLRQRFVDTYPLEPYQSVVRYYDAARVGLELGEPTLYGEWWELGISGYDATRVGRHSILLRQRFTLAPFGTWQH